MNPKQIVALGLVYLIWGSTFLAIALALRGLPPLFISGARYFIAGTILFAFLRARGAALPSRRETWQAALVGVLLVAGNACLAVAEQWVSSGLAAVALASIPLWIALFAAALGHRPNRREWIGLGIGLAGVLVLQTGSELRASVAGALVLTLACALWGLGTALGVRWKAKAAFTASAVQMIIGSLLVLATSWLSGERPHIQPGVPLWALAYLAVFGSLIAYSAYQYCVAQLRPALTASYAYVNPVIALALGALVNGEPVARSAIFALALILAGVALVALAKPVVAARPGD